MSVAKITEISSASSKSFDDAIHQGIDRACKTLKNVTGAWVQDHKLDIENGKVTKYRVSMKVSFILE